MEQSGLKLKVLRAVLGLGLCVAIVTAAPTMSVDSQLDDDDIDSKPVHVTEQELQSVVHLLHSLIEYNRRHSVTGGSGRSLLQRYPSRKRGFGIAGLDNVDMITSTLDRSRSFTRPRQSPVMSSGLSIAELRNLMKIAG